MLSDERKAKIREYVQQRSSATVQEISDKFGVSESTVRRDLQELEEANLLRRTHGGAVSLQVVNFEPTVGEKEDQFRSEKIAIAERAAGLIEEGDTILLDSGTTTLHLVQRLKEFSRLTIVTNSLLVAGELQHHPTLDVIVTGGSLRQTTLAMVGPIAEQTLDQVRVDKAFVAANAIDVHEGLTTPNLIEAATKRKMIAIAKQVVLLADHSKFGKVTFAKVAKLSEIDHIITDHRLDESVTRHLQQQGIEVSIVQPKEERHT